VSILYINLLIMKFNLKPFILTFALACSYFSFGQGLTQTIRGTLIDTDTKLPMIGAKVIVTGTDPIQGAVADVNGDFKIENVQVGRIALKITSIGYKDVYLPNILLESGKEKVLQLEMTEEIQTLKEVKVTSRKDKSESINNMATVSAKTFTVEETNRYSGSLNDPARMVSAFAGVTGDAEGDNDIVVRGNSPRGILWRLDGIDIPNPNHFAGEGSTGGPVNSLNGSMLANSDFFSGAFAPEYGNALSGVFDVRFRQGNNEQREYTFSAGIIGLDGTLEGPFKKGYRGSYLVNYRYSSIALLDKAGILDFDGIPKYQDASFKLVFPTKNAGTFSLIGLGGMSNIVQTDQDEELKKVYGIYAFRARMGVVGLKHTYVISPKLYVKSYVAATSSGNGGEGQGLRADSSSLYNENREYFTDSKIKAQTIFHYKLDKRNLFQVGATYTHMRYNFFFESDDNENGQMVRHLDSKGNADMGQSFISWKHRFSDDLTLITGAHYTHFFLNNNYAIEPRAGLKWNITPKHNVAFGFGLHSRMESVSTYLYNELQADGTYNYPNRDLDLSKSAHYVLGYGFRISKNLHIKTELYYQHLYNVPVANDSASPFSMINVMRGIPDSPLVNEGTGRNYGVELTVERFFDKGFYYLITGSVYKSRYTALDGIERDTRYDANFAANALFGKEFAVGKKKKNKTIGLNTKVSYLGGNRYTGIDLNASQIAGTEVLSNEYLGQKGDNVFFLNFGVTYRVDMKRTSHSFKIDVQNITNNQSVVSEYYNSRTNTIEQSVQLPMIPNLIYTLKF